MSHEELPAGDGNPAEPTMELLSGDAAPGARCCSPLMAKLARGTMYGVMLLVATALLAVSAVPELAEFASFIPDAGKGICGFGGSASACTTIDNVTFEDSSCCAAASLTAVATDSASCCSSQEGGCLDAESVLASTESLPACCATQQTTIATTEPIDAGSLLAAAPAEQPADQQPAEQRSKLEPDENEIEE